MQKFFKIFNFFMVICVIDCQLYAINDYEVCGKRLNKAELYYKIVNGDRVEPGDWPWQVGNIGQLLI